MHTKQATYLFITKFNGQKNFKDFCEFRDTIQKVMYITCLLVTKTFKMTEHVAHEIFLSQNYQLLNINIINTCFRVVQVFFLFFFLIFWGNVININISTTKLPLRHVSSLFFQCQICSSYRISYSWITYVIPWPLFVNHDCYIPKCLSWCVNFKSDSCEYFLSPFKVKVTGQKSAL